MEHLALIGLGAWHGINPAMGWLFAVALAMQEGRTGAAARALVPLGIGHAGAVVAAVAVAAALGAFWSPAAVARVAGVVLIGFGVLKLRFRRHPRLGGMRVGFRDLTLWSFLMASAHGAGLMVVPFALGGRSPPPGHAEHLAAIVSSERLSLAAATIHTGSYLVVVGLVALVVHAWSGVGFLRRWWLNGDLIWAAALIFTGAAAAIGGPLR